MVLKMGVERLGSHHREDISRGVQSGTFATLLTPTAQHHDSASRLTRSQLRVLKTSGLFQLALFCCPISHPRVVEWHSALTSQTTRSNVHSRSRDCLSNGRDDIATHHAGNTMHSTACGNRQSCYTEPVDGLQLRQFS